MCACSRVLLLNHRFPLSHPWRPGVQVMLQKEGSFPGDMSLINPFEKEWEAWSEEEQNTKRAIELNNGRAAQMGILALMVHEQMDNTPYIINEILGSHVQFN